jgi:hypothetical protein
MQSGPLETTRTEWGIIYKVEITNIPYEYNSSEHLREGADNIRYILNSKIPDVANGYVRVSVNYQCGGYKPGDTHYSMGVTVIDKRIV